ncbi:hypothetical protein, conserved [Leishmania tarentolae]|uniref:Uncharacterized protein n=1 Tax=Leishmania tarentolae TaxID=5689 RepID=A0A640KF23_LEITA|nr:hypothetical protein, conserved [Leishmania tarentolae]
MRSRRVFALIAPSSTCGVTPRRESKFPGDVKSAGTASLPATKDVNAPVPPLTLRQMEVVMGTNGGSIRFACCGELMCSRAYMLAGMREQLATRRPNIFLI